MNCTGLLLKKEPGSLEGGTQKRARHIVVAEWRFLSELYDVNRDLVPHLMVPHLTYIHGFLICVRM